MEVINYYTKISCLQFDEGLTESSRFPFLFWAYFSKLSIKILTHRHYFSTRHSATVPSVTKTRRKTFMCLLKCVYVGVWVRSSVRDLYYAYEYVYQWHYVNRLHTPLIFDTINLACVYYKATSTYKTFNQIQETLISFSASCHWTEKIWKHLN